MITFEEIKIMFKQSIDESKNMNDALQKLVDKIYEQGKTDALEYSTQMVDKSNFSKEQYRMDTDSAWWCGYIVGKGNIEKVLEDIKKEITNERDNKGFCVWYYDDLMKKIDSHINGKDGDEDD